MVYLFFKFVYLFNIVTGIPVLVSNVDVQDIIDTFLLESLNDVYPRIGLTPKDIADAKQNSTKEQARSLLNLWRNREDNAATRGRMIAAMEQCSNYTAYTNRLKRKWRMGMELA